MSQTTLTATPRTGSGSPTARRLRAEGHIPGVLYGRGMEPISVTVERREFRLALSGPAGANTVLALQVGGTSYPAVVKEMQRHPIRRTVNHIDFLQVNMNEEITVHIAVRLEGESKAVAAAGGLVDADRRLDRSQLHPDRHAERVRLRHHRHAARHRDPPLRHPDAEGCHRTRRSRHGRRHRLDHRCRSRRAGAPPKKAKARARAKRPQPRAKPPRSSSE